MIMQYPTVGSATLTSGVTTVDCQKQVRSWRLLRFLMQLLIPSCNRALVEETDFQEEKFFPKNHFYYYNKNLTSMSTTTITGTIFGSRRGKVRFCIQSNPKSTSPILLLELAIPTTTLAREMKGGLLRIALECNTSGNGSGSSSLLSIPVWDMYCKGRKVGSAVKRRLSEADRKMLQRMETVVVGAGIVSGKEIESEDDVLYMRGKFERIQGSSNAESFHLMDPDGNIGQELSFFFLRSH